MKQKPCIKYTFVLSYCYMYQCVDKTESKNSSLSMTFYKENNWFILYCYDYEANSRIMLKHYTL